MDAEHLVAALLESDDEEFDFKRLANRATVLDIRDLKRAVAEGIPGIVVPTIHVLKPYQVEVRSVGQDYGPVTVMERQEVYVYYAREPRVQGVSPENYPDLNEQRNVRSLIHVWLLDHKAALREDRYITTQAKYKNFSPAILLKLIVDTPEGIAVTGHSNDEISSDLRAR